MSIFKARVFQAGITRKRRTQTHTHVPTHKEDRGTQAHTLPHAWKKTAQCDTDTVGLLSHSGSWSTWSWHPGQSWLQHILFADPYHKLIFLQAGGGSVRRSVSHSVENEMSDRLQVGISLHFVQVFVVLRRWIPLIFIDLSCHSWCANAKVINYIGECENGQHSDINVSLQAPLFRFKWTWKNLILHHSCIKAFFNGLMAIPSY